MLTMAKLYFYYASMNAGKSTTLLQANFNYHERGMSTMLWTAEFDDRGGGAGSDRAIESRIGLHADAHRFGGATDLWERITAAHRVEPLACVLVDEAQFLSEKQVWQLAKIADTAGIPVLCYGLRTDFQGELFPGAKVLLGIADSLIELKAVCHCGRKSSMNLRVDESGAAVKQGAQTEIGGNDRYVALCRKHFTEALGR
jgi:thymidine kinase